MNNGSGILTVDHYTGWTTLDVKLIAPDFLSNPDLTFVTGYQLSRNQSASPNTTCSITSHRRATHRPAIAAARPLPTPRSAARVAGQSRLGVDARGPAGALELDRWLRQDDGARPAAPQPKPVDVLAEGVARMGAGRPPARAYSIARAVRFPIVQELFDNEIHTYGTALSNAGLDPEVGLHQNLSVQRGLGGGRIEANMFRDNVDNTIFTQYQFVQGKGIYSFLPIDQVITNGVEIVLD